MFRSAQRRARRSQRVSNHRGAPSSTVERPDRGVESRGRDPRRPRRRRARSGRTSSRDARAFPPAPCRASSARSPRPGSSSRTPRPGGTASGSASSGSRTPCSPASTSARIARPHLEELVRITGETATLHVPGEEDAVTVDFVPSAHFIQHVTQLGRPSIAHATSAGKVMLAFTDRPLPRGPLRAYTPRTITSAKALAAEIERVRARRATPRRSRSASRASPPSPHPSGRRPARSPRSSRSRARPRASAGREVRRRDRPAARAGARDLGGARLGARRLDRRRGAA